MKFNQRLSGPAMLIILLLTFTISFPRLINGAVLLQDQQQPTATATLERAYRTGYSDGYQAGYKDVADGAEREFKNKEDYRNADRSYIPAYGVREDFRDGYQQGYEIGYQAGYDRRSFDSTAPAGLGRRATVAANDDDANQSAPPARDHDRTVNSTTPASQTSQGRQSGGNLSIPANTVMRVELLTSVSSDASQRGDRIQARVLEPAEYEGAMLDGRVTNVKRAGRARSNSELQLSFEQLQLPDGRWTDMEAQVIEVIRGGDSGVGGVDPEGGVRGRDSTKGDIAKVGAGTAIGAILGAIAGGGKGAAIGAVIGGATSTGGVLTSRGEDIRLPRGTELRVRTSRNTRVQ
jgi:hypothetical protein